MAKRVWVSVVAAGAALTLVPSTVFADQAPPFVGNAGTAALTVSVSPTALLTVPSSVMSALPSQVSGLLATALDPLSLQIDTAHASATRSATATDLSAGHADVTPVTLNLATLSTLLTEVHTALTELSQGISLGALQSTVASMGTLTGNSTVMALLPSTLRAQLTALNTQLTQLTATLAALPGVVTTAVDNLQSTLTQQLGAALSFANGLVADLDSAHPNGQSVNQPSITVPPSVSLPVDVPSLPVIAQLSPFTATAVNLAGARTFGVSGPQASSNESADAVTIGPAMDLSSLRTTLTTLQTDLQQVQSSITAINPQLAGVAAIISQALPGGLNLTTLQGQVTTVLPQVGTLLSLANGIDLNKLVSCNALGTNACSIASASVTPQGTGMHAVASSKLVDLSVLPMDPTLAGALAPLGAVAGAALLDVQALQSTSDTFIDATGGTQTTSGTVAGIAVAGLSVVNNGTLDKAALGGHLCGGANPATLPSAPRPGVPLTVCMSTPAGALTVIITEGLPQYTYSGAAHRSASISMLEIRLLNGAPDGSNRVGALGASGAGPVATVDGGAAASEVLAATAAGGGTSTTPTSSSGSNVVMEKTGMFGAGSLFAGFLLIGGGVVLRRRTSRRRRRQGA